VLEAEQRLVACTGRHLERLRGDVRGLARGLPHPSRLVEQKTQDLDACSDSLRRVMALYLQEWRGEVRDLAHRLRHPRETIAEKRAALAHAAAGLRPRVLEERLSQGRERLDRAARDLERCFEIRREEPRRKLAELSKLLESLSYKGVLARGYAVVRDAGRHAAGSRRRGGRRSRPGPRVRRRHGRRDRRGPARRADLARPPSPPRGRQGDLF